MVGQPRWSPEDLGADGPDDALVVLIDSPAAGEPVGGVLGGAQEVYPAGARPSAVAHNAYLGATLILPKGVPVLTRHCEESFVVDHGLCVIEPGSAVAARLQQTVRLLGSAVRKKSPRDLRRP